MDPIRSQTIRNNFQEVKEEKKEEEREKGEGSKSSSQIEIYSVSRPSISQALSHLIFYDGKYYEPRTTEPDGACGIHALIGQWKNSTIKNPDNGAFYQENPRSLFLEKLRLKKDSSPVKEKLEEFFITILGDRSSGNYDDYVGDVFKNFDVSNLLNPPANQKAENRKKQLKKWLGNNEVFKVYCDVFSKSDYYLSDLELDIAAHLFEKKFLIFTKANDKFIKVHEYGAGNNFVIIFHRTNHYERCVEITQSALQDYSKFSEKNNSNNSNQNNSSNSSSQFPGNNQNNPITISNLSKSRSTLFSQQLIPYFSLPPNAKETEPLVLDQKELEKVAAIFKSSSNQFECFNAVYKAAKERKWNLFQSVTHEVDCLVNKQGRSILLESLFRGEDALSMELIEKNVAVQTTDKYGNLAIHYVASIGNKDLLEKVKNINLINAQNIYGFSPVHVAVAANNIELLQDLINTTKALDLTSNFQMGESYFEKITPLHLAIIRGSKKSIDLLLKAKADFKSLIPGIGNIIHLIIHMRQHGILQHFLTRYLDLTKPLLESLNEHDQTPLMLAAFIGECEAIILLKEKGVSLEAINKQGQTAVHWAVMGMQKEAISRLHFYGCDLSIPDHQLVYPMKIIDKNNSKEGQIFKAFFGNRIQMNKNALSPPDFIIQPPENLVFKGGGPKGIAYVGAMKVLEDQKMLTNVIRVGGTSAGAINATLVAFGYNSDSLGALLRDTPLISFLDNEFLQKTNLINIVNEPWKQVLLKAKDIPHIQPLLSLYQCCHQLNLKKAPGQLVRYFKSIPGKIKKMMEQVKEAPVQNIIAFTKPVINNIKTLKKAGQKISHAMANPIDAISEVAKSTKAFFERMYHTTGICEGNAFIEWIESNIRKGIRETAGINVENCTFGELRKMIEQGAKLKHLHVFTSNLMTKKVGHFNSEDSDWDDLIISDVVGASMSIPGVFKPRILYFKINGQRIPAFELGVHVDGGLIRNFPIDAFDKRKYLPINPPPEEGEWHVINKRTLGLSLYSANNETQKPSIKKVEDMTVKELLQDVFLMYFNAEEILQEEIYDNKFRKIEIDSKDVSLLDFGLSITKKKELIDSGELATREFFNSKSKNLKKGDYSKESLTLYGPTNNLESSSDQSKGRVDIIKKLETRLIKNNGDSFKTVLLGQPGMGQIETVHLFMRDNGKHFSLIWRIDCETQEKMRQDYDELAVQLNVEILEKNDFTTVVQKVNEKLEHYREDKPYLIIFDHVKESILPPRYGDGRILIISEDKKPWPEKDTIMMPVLSERESLELMKRISDEDESEAMRELVKELDYNPLAITMTTSYFKNTENGVEDCLKVLRQNAPDNALSEAEKINRPFYFVWKLIRQRLNEEVDVLDWIKIVSFLDAEGIPLHWITKWLALNLINKEDLEQKKDLIVRVLTENQIMRYEERTKKVQIGPKCYEIKTQWLVPQREIQALIRDHVKQFKEEEKIHFKIIKLITKIAETLDIESNHNHMAFVEWEPHALNILKSINLSLKDQIIITKKLFFWFRKNNYHFQAKQVLDKLSHNMKKLEYVSEDLDQLKINSPNFSKIQELQNLSPQSKADILMMHGIDRLCVYNGGLAEKNAVSALEQAISIYQAIPNESSEKSIGLFYCYSGLGRIHNNNNEWPNTQKNFEVALKIGDDIKDNVLSEMAFIYDTHAHIVQLKMKQIDTVSNQKEEKKEEKKGDKKVEVLQLEFYNRKKTEIEFRIQERSLNVSDYTSYMKVAQFYESLARRYLEERNPLEKQKSEKINYRIQEYRFIIEKYYRESLKLQLQIEGHFFNPDDFLSYEDLSGLHTYLCNQAIKDNDRLRHFELTKEYLRKSIDALLEIGGGPNSDYYFEKLISLLVGRNLSKEVDDLRKKWTEAKKSFKGYSYDKLKSIDEYHKQLELLLKEDSGTLHPDIGACHYHLGVKYWALKDLVNAEKHLELALFFKITYKKSILKDYRMSMGYSKEAIRLKNEQVEKKDGKCF